jgi:predicted membrane protein
MQSLQLRHENQGSHPAYRIFFGLVIVAAGTAALLGQLRLIELPALHQFWPLALLLGGLARLAFAGKAGNGWVGAVLIAVGGVLMARNLGIADITMRDAWPAFVIAAGVALVMRGLSSQHAGAVLLPGDRLDLDARFSNLRQRSESRSFRGGRIELGFSNLELDLTDAALDGHEAMLDFDGHCSSLTLIVPKGWQVAVELDALLGSVINRTTSPAATAPRLVLRARTRFGSVEVRH